MVETETSSMDDTVESAGHYRFRSVLGGEWIKLISVRSTMWTLPVTAVAGVGLKPVTICAWLDPASAAQRCSAAPDLNSVSCPATASRTSPLRGARNPR